MAGTATALHTRRIDHLAGIDAALRATKPKSALELAQPHVKKAFARLVALLDAESEQVALGAVREILDRAYGKPVQAVAGQFDGKLTISWAMPGDAGITIDLPSKALNE